MTELLALEYRYQPDTDSEMSLDAKEVEYYEVVEPDDM